MADRIAAELRKLDHVTAEALAVLGDGAERYRPALLQPAGELLSLYGEELRSRACVVSDAYGGELFLLPDYTVPICRMHRERGGGAARIAYAGSVFRLPAAGDSRMPVEERQVGLEVFEAAATAAADADVLCRAAEVVRAAGIDAVVTLSDAAMGTAILESLEISARRRTRLSRRFRQPRRLRALLRRFAEESVESGRSVDLAACASAVPARAWLDAELARRQVPHVGCRRLSEIAERLADLAAEQDEAPIAASAVATLESALAVRGALYSSLDRLAALSIRSAEFAAAAERLSQLGSRLERAGFPPEGLAFDLAVGGAADYYDGMVFEIGSGCRSMAAGGRYGGLVRASGLELSAVGAAIWVERLIEPGGGGD